MYHMTTKPEQPAMIPQGFIYGTAAEACLDTYRMREEEEAWSE